MRMWMVDPASMCDRHLLGEHVELHMLVGSMRLGRRLDGFLQGGLIEPQSVGRRHRMLAAEMSARGMNHRSPLRQPRLRGHEYGFWVDVAESEEELARRCASCRTRMRRENRD